MEEQNLAQQIIDTFIGAMQGDEQAAEVAQQITLEVMSQQNEEYMAAVQEIGQRAEQGDQAAKQTINAMSNIAEAYSQQQKEGSNKLAYAKFGAKLDYVKRLNGICPDGYEMQFYKSGGRVCKKCMKKREEGGNMPKPTSVQEDFKTQMAKCGWKAKKPKKEVGGQIPEAKCGKQMKKACGGVKMPFKANGGNFPKFN